MCSSGGSRGNEYSLIRLWLMNVLIGHLAYCFKTSFASVDVAVMLNSWLMLAATGIARSWKTAATD